MGVVVKIVDRGFKKFVREIKKLESSPIVKIGIMAEDEARSDEIGNVELMTIHEFGTNTAGKNKNIKIPQRSIIRAGTDNNVDSAFALEVKEYDKVIKGKSSINNMVAKTGLFMEGKFKKRFSKKFLTPNAPSTIRQKKSDTPLIDTGQLRQSISSKVE